MNRRKFLSLVAALPVISNLSHVSAQDSASVDSFAKLQVGVMDKKNAPQLAKVGFNYLELYASRELVPDKDEKVFDEKLPGLKSLALPLSFLNGFIGAEIPMVGPNADHDKVENWAKNIFTRAHKLGVKVVTIGSGAARRCPKDFEIAKARDQFSTLLGRISKVAQDNNVQVTIENLNSGETNLCNSIAESLQVVTAAGPNVFLTADLFHMLRENDPPSELLKGKGRIIHCHVAEKELRTSPGTKGDDFRPYLRVLKQIGYNGSFSFECNWSKSVSPDKALAEFRNQLATL